LRLHSTPEAATNELEERLWTVNIPRSELTDYQDRHQVLSANFNRDNTLRLRLLAEEPIPGFLPVSPNLEDVYFATLAA
ncbi:MAG: ABC transporter ATP-binding protein, partial [Bacteroidota bacterium]